MPKGDWVNFFDETQVLEGGQEYTFSYDLGGFPLYAKAGTLLPLVKPEQFVAEYPTFILEPRYYGKIPEGEISVTLHEDDGASLDGPCNTITLTRRPDGTFNLSREGGCGHMMYMLL